MVRIYVGNLSLNPSEDDLRSLFGQWGEVLSCQLVTDRRTGKYRGYGFVEMEENQAKTASFALDGLSFKGQVLRVTPLDGC